MQRERSFHSDTAGNLPDGKGFGNAAALLGNNQAFESLNTGLVAFFDFDVNPHCASRTEIRNVLAELISGDFID